ncbi:MAG TPA: hypothetical protein VIP11_17785, partial [Gemmatimonadaceae bacterium]
MLVPYPPLEAYRRDVARLGDQRTFGTHDGRWVAAAILLHRYGGATWAERGLIGAELAKYLAFESELTFWRAGLQLGVEIEEAGAVNLAYAWVVALDRIVPQERTLDSGRILAYRARIARKLGDAAYAQELYARVEHLGEASAEPELTARAWIGYAVLATERGNYPDARRWYQAAALVADDTSCTEQSCLSHQGLMVSLAMAGEFDAAIVEGWQAFRHAQGDPDLEAEILANVAQALHDMGHFSAAIRGFGAVVGRTSRPRVLLAALGSLAMSAAALGRARVVHAAAERIDRLANTSWPYPVALALVDIADAFDALNDGEVAERYRARGLTIAKQYSLHQLVHRATEGKPVPAETA